MSSYTKTIWSNGGTPAISATNLSNIETGVDNAHIELQAHLDDATDAHAGSAITNTPAGNIAAITVQTAINELDTEKLAKSGDTITGALVVTATDAANLVPITVNQEDTSSSNAVNITNAGIGKGISITQNGNGGSLFINAASTTAEVLRISADSMTSGTGLKITSNSPNTTSRNLLYISNDNASATGAKCLSIQQDSSANGIFIDHNASGIALNIDSETTDSNALDIQADVITTGAIARLYSNSADTNARNLLSIINDNASATGAKCLSIQQDSNTDSLFINQNGNGVGLHIDNNGTANSLTIEGTTTTDLTLTKAGVLAVPAGITANITGNCSGTSGSTTGNAATVTTAAETSDTTCSIAFVTDVSGSLPLKTNTNLTFNASTGVLTAANAIAGSVTGNAATVTVVDSTSATTWPAIFDSATGSLAAKTDAGLTYNASTANLSTTTFTGALTGAASLNVLKSGDTMTGNLTMQNGKEIVETGVLDLDLTTFTETDPSSTVVIDNKYKATFTNIPSSGYTHLKKDTGAANLIDFIIRFDFTITADNGGTGGLCLLSINDDNVNHNGWAGTNAIGLTYTPNGNLITLFKSTASSFTELEISAAITLGVTYYCILYRAGSITTCNMYTDPERKILFDTLTGAAVTTTFRYVGLLYSYNNSSATESGNFHLHEMLSNHSISTGTTVHGLGSISTQTSSSVAITGGTITGTGVAPRIGTTASSATPTPNADTTDHYTVTALAEAATFGAPTGTPTDGRKLTIRIKDNATARALAWNAIYRAGTDIALPTTTVLSKTMYLGFIYNSADTKWDLVASMGNI